MLKFRWETESKKMEIGKTPKDWEERFLGDVLDIKYGNDEKNVIMHKVT